jgi:hypothetical protein
MEVRAFGESARRMPFTSSVEPYARHFEQFSLSDGLTGVAPSIGFGT